MSTSPQQVNAIQTIMAKLPDARRGIRPARDIISSVKHIVQQQHDVLARERLHFELNIPTGVKESVHVLIRHWYAPDPHGFCYDEVECDFVVWLQSLPAWLPATDI